MGFKWNATISKFSSGFSRQVLKIPYGTYVNFIELERQEAIYNKYVELGNSEGYNAQLGYMQVVRENPYIFRAPEQICTPLFTTLQVVS